MKKGNCLNSEVSYVIAQMGHFDQLTISDSGLPLPMDVKRIDLAVKRGLPSLRDVLEVVLDDLKIQRAYIALETKAENPELYAYFVNMAKELGIELTEMPHTEFKAQTHSSRAVIRTGESLPYSNIILESDVAF